MDGQLPTHSTLNHIWIPMLLVAVITGILVLEALQTDGVRGAVEPQSVAEKNCERFARPEVAQSTSWTSCVQRELAKPADVGSAIRTAALIVLAGLIAEVVILVRATRGRAALDSA